MIWRSGSAESCRSQSILDLLSRRYRPRRFVRRGGSLWHQRSTPYSGVTNALQFPIAVSEILLKRESLKKELVRRTNLISTRIAILGGSTTTEVKNMLELFLLAQGIQPKFYESGYNCYSEDIRFENPDLWRFQAGHRLYPYHLAQRVSIP